MHRFRKKSDAKPAKSPVGEAQASPRPLRPQDQPFEPLPVLPSDNDFRTSLILPSLSRRFTLLRASNGGPISLEDMRSRLADQRAKGAEYHMSEEEERLILDQLHHIRASRRTSDLQSNDGSSHYPESDYTASLSPMSSPTLDPQMSSSSINRKQKRRSNNLFSSSQMRDASYLRSVGRNGSGRSILSESTSEGNSESAINPLSFVLNSDHDPLDLEESNGLSTSSNGSAYSDYTSDKTPKASKLNLQPASSLSTTSGARVTTSHFKRISLALANVMKEIEEEGILDPDDGPHSARLTNSLPSSPPELATGTSDHPKSGPSTPPLETGGSNDIHHVVDELVTEVPISPYPRPGTTSPTPRIQGYIPGMPRPITPREFDSDDQARPRSTTPRAGSPFSAIDRPIKSSPSPQGILRRGSTSANTRALPHSDSPVFPSTSVRSKHNSVDLPPQSPVSAFKSPLHERRRPTSPLSGLAYKGDIHVRSVDLSAHGGNGPSSPHSPGEHSRQGSLSSIHDQYPAFHSRSPSAARSLTSPALPDSALLDSAPNNIINYSHKSTSDPQSASSIELSASATDSRSTRSSTPTTPIYSLPRSPPVSNGKDIDYVLSNYNRRSPKPKGESGVQNLQSPFSKSLVLSPVLNLSQTSLLSTASSYHSTVDSSRKASDAAFSIVRESSSSAETTINSSLDATDIGDTTKAPIAAGYDAAKEITEALKFFGLKQEHFVAMQDKLVRAASSDVIVTPRTPTLRRRNNSITSRGTPMTGAQTGVALPMPNSLVQDSQTKANALLDSVLNSIESATSATPLVTSVSDGPEVSTVTPQANNNTSPRSPSALRDLASALSGYGIPRVEHSLSELTATSPNIPADCAKPLMTSPEIPDVSFTNPTVPEDVQVTASAIVLSPPTPPVEANAMLDQGEPDLAKTLPYQASDFTATPVSSASSTPELNEGISHTIIKSHNDQSQLILDVSRKAAEATAALKSPSQANLVEVLPAARRRMGRRIDPNQISNPHLVSSSASVNTYTIYSPSSSQVVLSPPPEIRLPSKISKGMKMIRGTLKGSSKASHLEEITPWSYDPPSRASMEHSRDVPSVSKLSPRQASPFGNEHEYLRSHNAHYREASPLHSPPATSGPTLKSFLGRFRKSRRDRDASLDSPRSEYSLSRTTPPTYLSSNSNLSRGNLDYFPSHTPNTGSSNSPSLPISLASIQQSSAPAFVQSFSDLNPPSRGATPDLYHTPTTGNTGDEDVKKLFAAASNLGLDHEELSQLLSRSTSQSSKVGWRAQESTTSTTHSTAQDSPDTESHLNSSFSSFERAKTPDTDHTITLKRAKSAATRKSSVRRAPERNNSRRERSRDGNSPIGDSTIVRRTLIFPSEDPGLPTLTDLEGLKRGGTHRQRSTSTTSMMSARSVHDRTPTPPPSRTKRFSTDKSSPPVPRLMGSISGPSSASVTKANNPGPLSTHANNITYDSFYDMYSEVPEHMDGSDSPRKPDTSGRPSLQENIPTESGPGLQVLELSNGETIWSIVNDLRNVTGPDGDDMPVFQRQSFASEYSVTPSSSQETGSGVQLLFKEHKRTSSKSSSNSYLTSALKKRMHGAGGQRPNTKVFYSSSAQIGRLIESLSKGLDSASFNILPLEDQQGNVSPGVRVSGERSRSVLGEEKVDGVSTPKSFQSDVSVDAQLARMIGTLEAAAKGN